MSKCFFAAVFFPSFFTEIIIFVSSLSFSARDVLPYFKKFQDFVGEVENKEKYHGTGGPLGVMPTAHVQV